MGKRLILFVCLSVPAVGASAQGITGTWNATVATAQGPFALVFELVAEGEELMGSMINDFMGEVPLTDGKIDGNDISFRMTLPAAPGAELLVSFTGELDGDELKLTSRFEIEPPPGVDAEQSFVATRAEER